MKSKVFEIDTPCGSVKICFAPKFKRVTLSIQTLENCINSKLYGLGTASTLLWQCGQIQAFGKRLKGTCCIDRLDNMAIAASCEDALAVAIDEYFGIENKS